jgi:hypothetical protein
VQEPAEKIESVDAADKIGEEIAALKKALPETEKTIKGVAEGCAETYRDKVLDELGQYLPPDANVAILCVLDILLVDMAWASIATALREYQVYTTEGK